MHINLLKTGGNFTSKLYSHKYGPLNTSSFLLSSSLSSLSTLFLSPHPSCSPKCTLVSCNVGGGLSVSPSFNRQLHTTCYTFSPMARQPKAANTYQPRVDSGSVSTIDLHRCPAPSCPSGIRCRCAPIRSVPMRACT